MEALSAAPCQSGKMHGGYLMWSRNNRFRKYGSGNQWPCNSSAGKLWPTDAVGSDPACEPLQ